MSRRREAQCYTDEAEALFEVISPDDLDSEQERLAATVALGHLATRLNELTDPLNSAAADVGPADVAALMRPMPVPVRGHMLNHLGLGRMMPQKVPQALCRDIAARMHNGRPHDQWHAMWLLTLPVAKALQVAATVHVAGAGADEAADAAGLARWPDRVLRAALWTELRASCEDARLLAWAATQPWWLPSSLLPEHGQAVLDAARAVIDASPSFVMPGMPDGTQLADDEAADGGTVAPSRTATAVDMVMDPLATAANVQQAAATATAAGEEKDGVDAKVGAMEMSLAPSAVEVLAWAVPACDAARAAQSAAAAAVDRVMSAIAGGRAPSEADLAAVHAYRSALTGLLVRLAREVPELAGVDALHEVDAQLVELTHTAELAEQQQRMDVLLRLQVAPGHDTVSAAVDRMHALIRDGDEDLPTDALLALRDLVEHVAAHGVGVNVEHLSTLHRRSLALPAELSTLPTAALVGQLSIVAPAQAEQAVAVPEPESGEPATESAGRPAAPLDGPAAGQAAAPAAAVNQTAVADPEVAEPATAQSATEAPQVIPDVPTEPAAAARDCGPEPAPATQPEPSTAAVALVPPAEPTPQRTADPGARPQPTERDVEAAVATLITTGRLGLAAVIAETAELSPELPMALRLAALAGQIRSDTSPAASRVRALLTDAPDLAGEDVTLTLAVPALLRTALAAGDHTAGALLANLAPRLDPHLSAVAEQVGTRALRGVLVGGALRTAVTDVADLDDAITRARQSAQTARRPRTLRFKRASDIAKHWLAPGGLFGELLDAAENDDRARHGAVSAAVIALSNHGTFTKHLEQADRQFRGHSGKPLEGQGRQDLVTLAAATLDIVSGWLSAVSAREAAQTGAPWAAAEVTDMRDAVRGHTVGALAELEAKIRRDKALPAATAVYARSALADVFTLLDSGIAPAQELAPEALLTGELLKVPGAAADPATGKVTLPADVTLRALLDAATLDWAQAFTDKLDAEDYRAAAYLLDTCRRGELPGAADLGPDAADRLATARQASVVQLGELYAELDVELRKARIHSLLSAEQDLDLSVLMTGADPAEYSSADADLGWAREQLARVTRMLPQFKEEAARRLQDRVDQFAAHGETAHLGSLARLIADGELSTAEELISSLESGHGVPKDDSRKDFTGFFPSVPDALSEGITRALLRVTEAGEAVENCPALDFADLSRDGRSGAADALRAWMVAKSTPVEGRATLDDRSFLLPALRLIGFDFRPGSRLSRLDTQRGKERRLVEITEVTYTGKAMVPDFGSALRGRLRVLVCWGQPSEDLLLSWVDQDPGQHTVLVAYFGTMPAAARRRLAVRALATDASVAVLDDAALAYLAAHGGRQLDAAMAVLLPFTAVLPYAREKRSLVPPEMFYGRDAERRDVLNMRGTQIIYGGRGLGKSALLRDAKAKFERIDGQVGVYVDLKATEIGPDRQGADAVWPVLLRRLQEGGVLPIPKGRAAQRGTGYDDVRAGILDWLARDPQRQLLVLLDESDHFFERDAPHFQETNRLKDLGALPGVEGRAKVVFAGLHSVQRFAKVPNQTFKHLAQQPTVIGPLRPQYAYNLITRPLGVLGYEFERDELVHRVIGYCSYQPFLLQMFAHRLVEHMHEKRKLAAGILPQPPYPITRDDVDAVEEHPLLKRDIAETFSDTLNLDPRYYVIANVLAGHAYQLGLDARLNDRDLREECRSWWALGFEDLDMEVFRTYLQEMVGLGVLAQNTDGRGWHLRSPNTLRMIGTREQVEENLLGAADEKVAPEFLALASRRTLPEHKVTAPLTAVQVADVLGDRANQVRVVLGSDATGIGHVTATLRAVEIDLAGRYSVVVPTDRKQFTQALIDGEPGARRVVLADLAASGTKPDACIASLDAATSMMPAPGVTRSAVLVCGPQQMPFWRELLDRPDAEQVAVQLRRYDAKTLRVWALEDDRPFGSEEYRARLLEVTGGWPLLVDEAAALAVQLGSQERALAQLEQQLADPAEAAEFLEMAGIDADPELAAAMEAILSLTEGAPVAWADLVEAAAESAYPGLDAAAAAECLSALDVFDLDPDGNYAVTPLVVACWPHRQGPASI